MRNNPGIRPFSTTGIGSLPHTDPVEAAQLVLDTFDIPFWPQLPALGFRELMIPQYSEGMPCIRLDYEKQDMWFERDEEEIQRFYETCAEGAGIAISEDYAQGFYAFLSLIAGRRFEFLKGHITGPLTFTLGLKDKDGRPMYFDEELRQIALMLLGAKARWQIDLLGRQAERVIIFIDEPILSALGSTSYVGVDPQEASRLLTETSQAIRDAGGIPGIHCCGRADWAQALESGVDIMNFDAYGFASTLGMYPREVTGFLQHGGVLAWGIVPTTDDIDGVDADKLERLFNESIDELSSSIPRALLLNNIILTPSCGTGGLSTEQTHRAFDMLRALKEAVS